MARVRSVDFLPEIFQTDANKQFLAATLDQLVQEPKFRKTQGFIGRRIGPGVNPNDKYVVEPTKTRTDYQLEPGVISLDPENTNSIQNSITYPGILDALKLQGADSGRPDQLFSSEYYTWDPFVDFDAFVNFNQYYWVPDGPDVVDVYASTVPTSDDFTVERQNGVYTFSGATSNNPTIELVRGGSYTFQISNNIKETVVYRVTAQGTSSYQINYETNPTLTLVRGNTYVFTLSLTAAFPFWIKTEPVTGIGDAYNSGVTNNGSNVGTVTFTVPLDAPDTLYYSAENNTNMHGQLNIVDNTDTTGPGFWIQTAPGVTGRNPATPNISTRDVLGVTNNGINSGTVTFDVPLKTEQSFYYSLNDIGTVDLATDLTLAQINGANVEDFIAEYGGIDGITNLEGRTLVTVNPEHDPLTIPVSQYYGVWQITYVNIGGADYFALASISQIDILDKFLITYGAEYSNTQWYKNYSALMEQIPLLSAIQDVLYYQDGVDPAIVGRIKLIEPDGASVLDINSIVGQPTYTSPVTQQYPTGVQFTNGLKVKFTGEVYPRSYWSGTVTVLCYSTATGVNLITCDSTDGLDPGQTIQFTGTTFGGISTGTTYYVKAVLTNTQFSVSTVKDGPTLILTTASGECTAVATSNKQYYVSGVGTAIELLPVENFIVPEGYATDANTETVYVEPAVEDYITIARSSKDLNAWSRSNRWFNVQVLADTATYNGTPLNLDNSYRGTRPIIQFRAGIRLFNMGTEGKQPVNAIDFDETDAFSNIQGSLTYTIDGYTLVNGSRVIFAADQDADVRNKVWVVNFIVPNSVPLTTAGDFHIHARYTIASLGTTDWNAVADTTGETYAVGDTILVVNAGSGTGTATFAEPVIHLIPTTDSLVLVDQSTVVLNSTNEGNTYWYDGVEWILAQQKTAIQQPPLFDIYDPNGYSLGNNTIYPSSSFVGTKLFSYAIGVGTIDPVLQFQLKYQALENIGDIVFDNNLYIDSFVYVVDNVSSTQYISIGCPREYASRTSYARLLGWQTGITNSQIRQQFSFTYTGEQLLLDVAALTDQETIVPAIKVYVGSVFQYPDTYTVTRTDNTTIINLLGVYVPGDAIEVEVLSNQTSAVGFYQVPSNLEQNPLNANSEYFTLGTIRTHYGTICQNLTGLVGPINGQNNTRDLGNIIPYGELILQQSSPLTMAGYFMRSTKYNVFAALEYNSREYQKYKNQLLEATTRQTIDYNITTGQLLDTVIGDVIAGRTDANPFYWSDMIPASELYNTTSYTIAYTTTDTFNTLYVYNYTSANYLGMNVYVNGEILTRGTDYTVGTNSATITLSADRYDSLNIGDVLTIQEYQETYGTFVPNTPTKLGLYPAWKPGIIAVKSSAGTTSVIQGHDGSQTPLFNDIRDQVLLEFETRIYNNLKLDGNPVPLTITDVLPGQFRSTGYSWQQITNLFAESFLNYVGANRLDYTTQTYNASNSFTFNYSQSLNKLDNKNLLGAWRGIYRYFYDTQQPELTPWEMLGFTIQPAWWELTYGPAPYTSDNQVLWDDLELGLVRDPVAPYVLPQYARPGLSRVLPTDSEGALLPPLDSVVGIYGANTFQKSWKVGDGGPVEASWWNSSDYPFAVSRILALTKPAEFFALFADRDLYRYQEEFGQYLYDERYRLSTRVNPNQPENTNIQVYGNGVSKASYIDWIVDYNKATGQDSTVNLQNDLSNIDVRLCYRMACFSDKQYIKLYTEKSNPSSTNTSFLIPDESYDLLLYKNQPFDRSVYSAVVIQVVENGWAVFGYSSTDPSFNILTSLPVGQFQTFTAGNTTVQVPKQYTDEVTTVPYGYVYQSQAAVATFLIGYGKYLEKQGFTFTTLDNGYILTWNQMVQEFLYWSTQGWGQGTLINLNPLAYKLSVTKPLSVVDSILAQTSENVLLTQNKDEYQVRDLNIVRLDNTFTIEPLANQSLSFIDMRYTSFESMIVLNNTSLFGDLLYEPITGARQSRLLLIASTTTEWNGSVDAQGFILNQDNIEEWTGLKTYPKGELVKYKGTYWSAATIVQPSTKFNYNDWNQSDYTLIQQGLLPNLSNKADQLVNSYNINSANLESDNDLLSYGLIGFRPRQYFTSLNLDDVSQLNIYREFISTKGTLFSTDLLSNADLGKETADYQIYENWAIQRAVYGANANRSFFDLRLNRALLTSDPVLIEVVVPQQASEADQAILLSDVWNSSFPLTTTDILPTTTTQITDVALPTAGYVNIDDVDISVFELSDPASLSANINSIQNGTIIWVAKINDYNWGIYRSKSITGSIQHVCDNLNGTSRVIFSNQHGLSVGDTLIIRFFDSEVNGVYKVLSVADLNTVNIAFTFTAGRVVANGNGIGFTLQSLRVAQGSDVDNLSYKSQFVTGSKLWIDDNGAGNWEVLKKQNPFANRGQTEPLDPELGEQFGTAVSQSLDQLGLLSGAPNYTAGGAIQKGGVYVYLRDYSGSYNVASPVIGQDVILTLNSPGTRNFGCSLTFGGSNWAAAGASASLGPNDEANNGYVGVIFKDPDLGTSTAPNPYAVWQLIPLPGTTDSTTPGAAEFGYAVAVSEDERWMYVGGPGLNRVYTFGRVDWTDQYQIDIVPAVTSSIYIADSIQIDNDQQISVQVNTRTLVLNTDYIVDSVYNYVIFNVPLAVNDVVTIRRNKNQSYPGGSLTYQISNGLFGLDSIYSFTVTIDENIQRPFVDYTFSSGVLTFFTEPSAESIVGVNAQGYFKYVSTIAMPDAVSGARFGHSVRCSTDGRQVLIGCPNDTAEGYTTAGSVYVYDRNVQKFISTGTDNEFTVLGSITSPVSVLLNNQFLTNQENSTLTATDTFTVSGSTITINAPVAVGDVIEIETNQFVLQQKIIQQQPAQSNNFGQSVDLCPYNCSLYVGVPQDSTVNFKSGVVQRSVAQARIYGTITSTIANPSLTPGQTLRVNNVDIEIPVSPNNNVTGLAAAINAIKGELNAIAYVSSGYITISVLNSNSAPTGNKLQVAPGQGSVYDALGFEEFIFTQTIANPVPLDFAAFGYSVDVSNTATSLIVGAPYANIDLPTTFDYDSSFERSSTTFDGNSTVFYSQIVQSGAVYTFDYFPSASNTVADPGKFIFGQQISDVNAQTYDRYGTSISYNDKIIIVGAPASGTSAGSLFAFENSTATPAWTILHEQQPVVDIYLLNSVYMYDRITSARSEFFDFFNPLQGKILGAAQRNLDYIGAVDPAEYNIGYVNNTGNYWDATHVGEMWWDISTVRFIDPNQDNIVYASRRWGQIFPGSRVDVYQWVESTQPPASYVGTGIPRNATSYVINTSLNQSGTFNTLYYFWVRNVVEVATHQGKTLSSLVVSQYIENPKSSGIAYIAPINASTIAIYNGLEYINAFDTIISIDFDQQLNDSNIHTEYELVAQGRADAFISDALYRKLQDSFCGTDTFGHAVPDPNLPPSQRYGVQVRPRQSMFVDRYLALKNYITRANSVFALYPITEIRNFSLLNSQEPIPSANSGAWDAQVANLETLSYQDIYATGIDIGYKYLVLTDSSNNGLWTIYSVELVPEDPDLRMLVLTRVQNYKTSDYWSYVNWYLPGYNSSSKIYTEVPDYASLATLNAPLGSSVKVTSNSLGKYEIYLLTDTGWERVGLENGTIKISAEIYDYQLGRFGFDAEVYDAQYFDQEPVIETRKIIQAINEELFIDELAIERNKSLTMIFDFILSELQAPDWLVKTSLIDVDHRVRELLPYPNYQLDNQTFVSDYLQEVKPYHVQVREFNLSYSGIDDYLGSITDFDVPAYYNTSLTIPQYVSPILLPYAHATNQLFNTLSDASINSIIWSQWPYSQWIGNYLLSVNSIIVEAQGQAYLEQPTITFEGDCTVPAQAEAVINTTGQITAINVLVSGSGYRTTPTIVITSLNGYGAKAYPVMVNRNLEDFNSYVYNTPTAVTVSEWEAETNSSLQLTNVRSFKTVIKYDRYQYSSDIVEWSSTATYAIDDRVRYDNAVWIAVDSNGPSASFNLTQWEVIPPEDLSGVDRTMGYYVPGINQPGLDLPLLVEGVDYPGVQVFGRAFDSVETLDAIYESSFSDVYLGTRFTDINVDGGEFVGPYEGHAPEELVNGAEYDTMDFRVYSTAGADWTGNGHGFKIVSVRYTINNTFSVDTFSWADAVKCPSEIVVTNITTGFQLTPTVHYTIDWVNQTITIDSGASANDVINIDVYDVGGGNQLFEGFYQGADLTGEGMVIPVDSRLINSIAIFVNGTYSEVTTWRPWYEPATLWDPEADYAYNDVVYDESYNYYRAIRSTPAGTLLNNYVYWQNTDPTHSPPEEYQFTGPFRNTYFELPVAIESTDTVTVVALGETSPTQYGWSTPQFQYVTVDNTIHTNRVIFLDNNMGGTNLANLVVVRNGLRLTPPADIAWTGDDSTLSFGLPQRLGSSFSQATINASTDIFVWVDGIFQNQGLDYTVSAYPGNNNPGRQVIFTAPPAAGAKILISVSTVADYTPTLSTPSYITLTTAPTVGDVITVISWNDTSEQDMSTLVFVGPSETGIIDAEPYSSTPYSFASDTPAEWILADTYAYGDLVYIQNTGYPTVFYKALQAVPSNTSISDTDYWELVDLADLPGSYDYSLGIQIPNNDFYLNHPGITGDRLWVTLNGYRLFEGQDYTILNNYLILSSGTISAGQTLVVTEFTEYVNPDPMAFRIFQDMRGVQAVYRITDNSSTVLTQDLSATDDIIYVADASKLGQPNLSVNIWGVLTINGERIMYREIDLATNTVSSLLRGTAGTGADSHIAGSAVYDMGRANLLDVQYQDYIDSYNQLADGEQYVFVATGLNVGYQDIEPFDTTLFDQGNTTDQPYTFDYATGYTTYENGDYETVPPANFIEVYVGGIRQFSGFGIDFSPNPTVTFSPAPAAGREVTLIAHHGTSWYTPGVSTASNGIALQETDTPAARFLRGL